MKNFHLLFPGILFSLLSAAQEANRPNATFAVGNLVIYRVGTGAAPLNVVQNSNAVFLDEYTTAGAFVQSIALPTVAAGANKAITATSNLVEGFMSLSRDGRYLITPGYNAPLNTAVATADRVIGRVDFSGAINSTTSLPVADFVGTPRSATSSNGTDIWVAGNGGAGVRYTTLGATSSTLLGVAVVRQISIFRGQLYISTVTVATVGTGMPTTTGQLITPLPGVVSANPGSFFFADINPGIAGLDVLYVADVTSGLLKFSFNGTLWLPNGSIATSVRGLTGIASGTNVILYATNGTNLLTVTDASGYNSTLTGSFSTLATAPGAGANQSSFRGVTFTPSSTAIVLPVNFGTIKASQQTGGIRIDWENLTEENVIKYSIERAGTDQQFTTIGTQPARINNGGKAAYSFLDPAPLDGTNFYRIHSLEENSQEKYSIIVRVDTKDNVRTGIRLFPNPVIGNVFSLQLNNIPTGEYTIRVYNSGGQQVYNQQLSHRGGSVSQTIQLPAAVKPGIYHLEVSSTGSFDKLSHRIVIQSP